MVITKQKKPFLKVKWFKDITLQKESLAYWKLIWESTLWLLWIFLINIFWIIILWISIMAAMKTSKITETITKPIADFGASVWGIVAKSPGYLPIFGWQSMESLKKTAGTIDSSFDSSAGDRSAKFLDGTRFTKDSELNSQLQTLRALSDKWTHKDKANRLLKILKLAKWDSDKLYRDKNFRDTLFATVKGMSGGTEMLNKAGISSASGITLNKLASLLKDIDSKPEYSFIYKNAAITFDGNTSSLKEFIKGIAEWDDSIIREQTKAEIIIIDSVQDITLGLKWWSSITVPKPKNNILPENNFKQIQDFIIGYLNKGEINKEDLNNINNTFGNYKNVDGKTIINSIKRKNDWSFNDNWTSGTVDTLFPSS